MHIDFAFDAEVIASSHARLSSFTFSDNERQLWVGLLYLSVVSIYESSVKKQNEGFEKT